MSLRDQEERRAHSPRAGRHTAADRRINGVMVLQLPGSGLVTAKLSGVPDAVLKVLNAL
ncbi:MAG TPA: hypothetical protein VKR31_06295 [Rhizomicrobium sp.]|nr:hypothetical protein [Rhizomicrobium sp.]